MTAYPPSLRRSGALGLRDRFDAIFAAIALVAGALVVVKPELAIVFVLVACTGLFMATRPSAFVPLLIVSVYFGAVTFGSFTIARIVGPLALVVAVVTALQRGEFGLRGSSIHRWVAAYGLLATASLYWTWDPSGTLGLLISLVIAITYMLAIVGLTVTRADLQFAMRAFPFAAIGLSALGLYALRSYTDIVQAEPLIGDRNFFAAFLVVALAPSVAMFIEAKQRWLRGVAVLAIGLIVGMVIASGSQGGMLALVGSALLALMIAPPPRWRRRILPAMVIVIPATIFVVIAILSANGQTSGPTTTKTAIERSSIDRVNLWRGAIYGWKKDPLLGMGFGAYASHASELMIETPGVDLRHYNLPDHPQEAHNSYVEALTELGPLGLIVFVGLLGVTAWTLAQVLRIARARGDTVLASTSLQLIIGMVAFAIASTFLSIQTNRGWWVIFGLTIVAARLLKEEPVGDARAIAATTS